MEMEFAVSMYNNQINHIYTLGILRETENMPNATLDEIIQQFNTEYKYTKLVKMKGIPV